MFSFRETINSCTQHSLYNPRKDKYYPEKDCIASELGYSATGSWDLESQTSDIRIK